MNHGQEASITRDGGLCTFLSDNASEYASDVPFETIATKTIADYALTKLAAAEAAADNTGYSLDKVIAKEAASVYAYQLCASSRVKLDILGNNVVSRALKSSVTFFSRSSDALCASRLQNVHDVMSTHLAIITSTYLTAPQLATLQTKINTYTDLSGTTTSVNTTSTVKTKALGTAVKTGAADVVSILMLAAKYKASNPTFYDSLLKNCKLPAITVRHTPVLVAITDSVTGLRLGGVSGTLSKTKELGVGTDAGIINYTNVSAGAAISTCALDNYLTGVQYVRIKRGKPNAFSVALVPGVMTAEMEAAITLRVNAFIVAEEAKRLAKVAKAKAAREAKKAKK